MLRPAPFLLSLGALALAALPPAAPAWAQKAPAAPAAPAAAASAAASPAASERRVIEDDQVRIEETRVRGQVQQITVQSKIGDVRPYEIVVGRGGRDPSQDKSAAGQRVWSLLKF
jgi:hypothetical protein